MLQRMRLLIPSLLVIGPFESFKVPVEVEGQIKDGR